MMKVKEIIQELERFAPPSLQEGYDNSGLQVGDINQNVDRALLCLDVTEEIVQEAIDNNCSLILSHHPLIFGGLRSLTGKTFVERALTRAIKNDIAIYSAHTNLDAVAGGVNRKIAERLGLRNRSILKNSTGNLLKLMTYVPNPQVEAVRQALFDAGAGHIGEYSECSFSFPGQGSFRPSENTHPTIGTPGGTREEVAETKVEVVLPLHLQGTVLAALHSAHPYEEVAYDLFLLQNENEQVGAGMIGELEEAMGGAEFLAFLKDKMQTACIRHTKILDKKIKTVAVCGGSGSFLLPRAIARQADAFVTADFKYHQFFDAEERILIADIGHYESEQFTLEIFSEVIRKKFPNFATLFTKHKTNPVNYFF